MSRLVPDDDIIVTLNRLRELHGVGATFTAMDDFAPIHAELFPVETATLAENRELGGHDLLRTIGGQLFHYWQDNGGDVASGITRLGQATYRLEAETECEDR